MEFSDQSLRNLIYELLLKSGRMPSIQSLAVAAGRSVEETAASLKRLYAAKALVLMPDSGEILMAPPWSAVPTAYLTTCGGRNWWANCAWDALAIPAAMGQRGVVTSSCACCGEAMTAEVEGGKLLNGSGIVHIALPAKTWWEDIHYT